MANANAINETTETLSATTIDTNVAAACLSLSGTTVSGSGTDTDVNITLTPKGAGTVIVDGLTYPAADGNAGEPIVTDGGGSFSVGLLSVAGGGTGAATLTDHGVLVGSGTAAVTPLTALTDGQLVIGSTGNDPVGAAITAGDGIDVTNAAGAITITATGSGLDYEEVTDATKTMEVRHTYTATNAAGVAFTLPSTAVAGSVIEIVGKTGLWSIAQNIGQTIHVGSNSTTTGAGGSVTATNAGDCLVLRCITADTDFRVQNMVGNLTVV